MSNTGAKTSPGPSDVPAVTAPASRLPRSRDSGRRRLVLIGDSLAVGVRAALPTDLPGWTVIVDGRVGRPLAEGLSVLASRPLPRDGSTVLAVSLFTNDDPTHVSQLRAGVQATLNAVGPLGCVIWATIARPPLNGVSYGAANAELVARAAAEPRLQLVPWAQITAARPSLLAADGVHPTPQGYALRSRLYAQAVRACP